MAKHLRRLRESNARASEAKDIQLPKNANWRDIGTALVDEWMLMAWEEEALRQEEEEYWENLDLPNSPYDVEEDLWDNGDDNVIPFPRSLYDLDYTDHQDIY